MLYSSTITRINTVVSYHLAWNVIVTYISCLRISVDRKESIERKNKRITMVQLQNGSFVNGTQ